jgi:hypothetical protein
VLQFGLVLVDGEMVDAQRPQGIMGGLVNALGIPIVEFELSDRRALYSAEVSSRQ